MFILGEIPLGFESEHVLAAPFHQLPLVKGVQDRQSKLQAVLKAVLREHLAVLDGIAQLGVEHRVIVTHPEEWPPILLAGYRRLAPFEDLRHTSYDRRQTIFPRDLCMVVGQTTLVSPATIVQNPSKNFVRSVFGEGGRILVAGKTAIVPETIILPNCSSRSIDDQDLKPLIEQGFKIARIPPFLSYFGGTTGVNDHLDRAACLLRGTDGREHLVVDHGVQISQRNTPQESFNRITWACFDAGIVAHQAPPPRIPYALNLVQAPNGKVLMTSGDDTVKHFIESIVGAGNVITTRLPIEYLPAWFLGGIRCLIAETPSLKF